MEDILVTLSHPRIFYHIREHNLYISYIIYLQAGVVSQVLCVRHVAGGTLDDHCPLGVCHHLTPFNRLTCVLQQQPKARISAVVSGWFAFGFCNQAIGRFHNEW